MPIVPTHLLSLLVPVSALIIFIIGPELVTDLGGMAFNSSRPQAFIWVPIVR